MSRARLVTALAVALIVVAVTGAAVAATGALSPKQERQAVLDDAAKQLGVTPADLDAALKQALKNRVDAAVKAGRLTKEEGDGIKKRIDSGDVPFLAPGRPFGPKGFGFGHHGHHGHVLSLDAAATYLGLTEAELRQQLESGKTLADVATDRGKSVDGLVDAMVAEKTKAIDAAVAAGKITKAERDDFVAGLKKRTTDIVTSRFPPHEQHEFRERGASLPFPTA